jgi:hypothetical protein
MKVRLTLRIESVVAELWLSKGVKNEDNDQVKVKVVAELDAVLSKENITKIIHQTYVHEHGRVTELIRVGKVKQEEELQRFQ